MYAKLAAAALVLASVSCTLEAGEALEFPNYVQASVTLPGDIALQPVFSQAQNYAVTPCADTLYHLELRHGRIHGRTGLPGTITGLARGTGSAVFAVAGGYLCRIDGFELTVSAALPGECSALGVCGNQPVLLMDDGTLVLRDPDDLSETAHGTPGIPDIGMIQGFPGLVTAASYGELETLSVPSFERTASNTVNGSVTFLGTTGRGKLLFSCDTWNEAASCSPEDLVIEKMFTFPKAPTDAAADSSVTYVFGVIPGSGVQVCRESGEIAWRSPGYPDGSMVVLSEDCETAVIVYGSSLDILVL